MFGDLNIFFICDDCDWGKSILIPPFYFYLFFFTSSVVNVLFICISHDERENEINIKMGS